MGRDLDMILECFDILSEHWMSHGVVGWHLNFAERIRSNGGLGFFQKLSPRALYFGMHLATITSTMIFRMPETNIWPILGHLVGQR